MSLFEFFLKLHSGRKESRIETTATFTGRRNKAAKRTKAGFCELDYYEYEIVYFVGDKEKRKRFLKRGMRSFRYGYHCDSRTFYIP